MKITQQPQIINKNNYQTNVTFNGLGLSKVFRPISKDAVTLSPQAQLNKTAKAWLKTKRQEFGDKITERAYEACLSADNNVFEPAFNLLKKFLPEKKTKIFTLFKKKSKNEINPHFGIDFLSNMLFLSKNYNRNHTKENILFLDNVLENFKSYNVSDYWKLIVLTKNENGNVSKEGIELYNYFRKNKIENNFPDFLDDLSKLQPNEKDFITKNYTKIKNNSELFKILDLINGTDSKNIINAVDADLKKIDTEVIKKCLKNSKTQNGEVNLGNYQKLKAVYIDDKNLFDYIDHIKDADGIIVDENIDLCKFLTLNKTIKNAAAIEQYMIIAKDKNGVVNSEIGKNLKKILQENLHPDSHSNIIYCINNLKNNKDEIQWDFVNIFSALKNITDKNLKAEKHNTFDKILALSKDSDGNIIKTLIPEYTNLIKSDLLLETPNILALSKKGNDFDTNNFKTVFDILKRTNIDDRHEMSEFLLSCRDKNGNLDTNKISLLNEIQKRGIKSNIIKLATALSNPDNTTSHRGLDLAEHLRKNSHHQLERDLPKIIELCRDKSGFINNKSADTVKNLQNLKPRIQLSELMHIVLNHNKEVDDNKVKVVTSLLKEFAIKDGDTIRKIMENAKDKHGVIDLEVLKLLGNLSQKGKDFSDYKDLIPAYRALYKYEHVTHLSQLNLRQKRTLMRCLTRYKNDIDSPRFREILNSKIFPNNDSEYCSILARLSHSLGIKVEPLSKNIRENFYKSLTNLADVNKEFMKIDFNTNPPVLDLTYKLHDFKNDVWNVVKKSHYSDRTKALDYFGMELKLNKYNGDLELTGYPSVDKPDARLAEIKNKEVLNLIQKLTPTIIRFTQNNSVTVQSHPQLSRDLTNIVKAFPEFLTTIGKTQHQTQDFTLDAHCLKVLQGVMKSSEFKKLDSQSKKQIQLTALLHDITKAEGVVDSEHPASSGFDVYYLLDKLGLKEKDKLKIYHVIKHHSWLSSFDFSEANAKTVAFNMREGNSFKMLCMLTEADLKGVQKNDRFYLKYAKKLEDAKKKILPHLYNLKKTSINLPQTKFPKARELNKASKYVSTIKQDGITNTILELKSGLDLQKAGFKNCKSMNDLYCLVHGLEDKDSASMFQALGMIDSKAVLSTSYISFSKGNYRAFRNEGFILDVPATNIHAAYWRDFGSGYKKSTRDLFDTYLFQNNPQREYISLKLKDELHLTDKEYITLFKKIEDMPMEELNTKYPKIANAYRKIFADMEISKRSYGRNYNEILVTSPKIQAIFCYDKKPEEISVYLRKYAQQHNIPIVVFG